MIKDNEHFSQIARQAILDYQECHKSAQASLQVVADKVGASYSTIRNILQNKTPISFKMAKNILLRLKPELTTGELIAMLDDESGQKLKKHYSHNLNTQLIEDKFEVYFQDERYFEILFRAFSDKGIHTNEIAELFGKFGLVRLDELLEVGLVINKKETIFGNTEKDINLSPQTNKLLAQFALNRYDSQSPEQSWLSVHSQTYSEESYNKIREILRESFKQIAAIETDDNGSFRAFISQLLIDIDQDKKQSQEQQGYYQ